MALSDISTAEHKFPEPDPPFIERGIEEEKKLAPEIESAPSQEWGYHKTEDNQHPDGNEQQMMWLMNRARSDPPGEGIWLSNTGDPDVDNALSYFGVNITVLQDEFATYAPKPPAAFDRRLYNAAKEHSDFLISIDDQNHDDQLVRVDAAGFKWKSWGGNVFSYARSALHGHAAFNVDWGEFGDNGMQADRGHRKNLMSIDDKKFYNVGIAVVQENDDGTDVGPLVITENYCEADTSIPDHYNNFIVGTVWTDSNGNSLYDPGEGIPGVTVTPDSGTYYAVTADSGGYAVPVTSQSIRSVTFSGSSLVTDIVKPVSVGTESVLLDVETSPIVTVILPDIKANNSDGPVTPTGNFSVTVALNPGSSVDNADWWVAANVSGTSTTIDGWYYFNLSTFRFVPVGDSPFNLVVTYQGPLFNLPTFVILPNIPVSALPSGTYTFYLAVDTIMNGLLDLGSLFFDSVVVIIP